ncbi:MAG: PEP-CTERM sorting domain-containing protein [Acidobacteriaceae bacterium]|nr:PEP-CTERM sorting domain-containing protein [Acidobacteriaceae bacterium]
MVRGPSFALRKGGSGATMSEMFIAPDPPLSTPEPESLALVFIGLSGTVLIGCVQRKPASRSSECPRSSR